MTRIRTRKSITTSLYDVKYQTYLDSFNSLKAEIHALRTKIGVVFGILGAIFTIIVGYSLTTSYSVDNLFPLLQAIYNLPDVLNGSLSVVTISPTKIPVVENFSSLLVASFVMLGIEYFWLYLKLHSLNSTVCPTTNVTKDMEMIQDRQIMEKYVLEDIKKTISQLSLDYKFYSAVSRGYDIFLLILLAILFIVYLTIISAEHTITLISPLLSMLTGAMTLCEIVLLGIFLIVVSHSKDERRKSDFVNNYPIKKYLRIFGMSVLIYFSIALLLIYPSILSIICVLLINGIILLSYSVLRCKRKKNVNVENQ